MPLLGDRVQETTTSAGTGSLALNGAVTGYVTFNSTFNNGDIVWYVIDDGVGNWEIGYGTVGTGTLTRTVFQSSNANALVNFAAGTKRVFCTAPYTYLLPDQTSNSGKILITNGTTSSWTSDYAGLTSANTFTNTQIINAQVGIGGAPSAGRTLSVTKDITGALQSVGVYSGGTTQSDVTARTDMFRSTASTAAAAFTLLSLRHYTAQQGTFGAGSSVSYQYGFLADSSLTGATVENHGFYSNISSGTGRYNFYAAGTAANYFAGKVGIGTTPNTFASVALGGTLTGQTTNDSITISTTAASDVTSAARGIQARVTTAASAFTLSNIMQFYANPPALGAGSTVTNQYGFHAESSLTGATNNYGFYSNIASGSGRYNFYAAGTADNYFGGAVGINTTSLTGYNFRVGGSVTGATTAWGVASINTGQSDVTANFGAYYSQPSTQATAYTLSNLYHYNATQGTIGAGSTVTNQYSFFANSANTGATNNFGFYSNIASGSGRYNFYAAGTANNYFSGALGIGGGLIPSSQALAIGKQITGFTTAYGVTTQGEVQSDVTSQARYYSTYAQTAASAFTLSQLGHFYATQGTIGAGSTVTNQYGVFVESSLTGATNNYGFYSNIASGSGRYNFYAAGTADNYFAGAVGIGIVPTAGNAFAVGNNLTGAVTARAINVTSAVQSDVTTNAFIFNANPSTAAASFTLSNLHYFRAVQGTIGAGSTVTNQYGVFIESSLTGATNNYGFYSNIASGSNRYNFYAAGTADNYFAGKIGIGGVPTTFVSADIQGTYPAGSFTRGFRAAATIPSSVVGNARLFSTEAYTEAASFTLATLTHYLAYQQTIGAGSTVTTQYGFSAETTLTGATNNYGFYSNIASGTGRYNFYAAGTAANYFAGQIQLAANKELIVGGTDTANNPQLTSDGTYLLLNAPNASGDIRFRIAGSERMRIDNAGNATISGSSTLGSGSANYQQVAGAATTLTPIHSVAGSDTNIPLAFVSKGTGGIDLAPGSAGVNISNGGTVTAITRTAGGSNYTTNPTVAITAPTTPGGTTATATCVIGLGVTPTIVSGGTGYSVNDALTISGGTFTTAAVIQVTAVSGGVITAVTNSNLGAYTIAPSGTLSVTGGTGTGATFTVSTWQITNTLTITNAGSGYLEQPTVSFSGGGGSGAAAYATVGSGTSIKSIGTTLDFYTPNSGIGFRVYDSGGTNSNYWSAGAGTSTPYLFARGSTNTEGRITSSGTSSITIYTNGGTNQQFAVAHTASAVNYVQVTGGVTSAGASVLPGIQFTGSDANVNAAIVTKGSGYIAFCSGGASSAQAFRILGTASSTGNLLAVSGAAAGASPSISAISGTSGSDANINIILTPKGTGTVQFGTYTASVLSPTGYITITDSGGTTRRLLVG